MQGHASTLSRSTHHSNWAATALNNRCAHAGRAPHDSSSTGTAKCSHRRTDNVTVRTGRWPQCTGPCRNTYTVTIARSSHSLPAHSCAALLRGRHRQGSVAVDGQLDEVTHAE
eukprot:scaffold111658_cov27-Tisochrysis_lutea.AAC.1